MVLHGIEGHGRTTWEHVKSSSEKVFWPNDLLPKELEKRGLYAKILSIEYDARMVPQESSFSSVSIDLRGLAMMRFLLSLGVGLQSPVIFICHSMGGLVYKSLTVAAQNYSIGALTDLDRIKAESLINNTIGNITISIS